jgi:uncharacterized protein YbbC (DUF1343 family)
MSIFRNKRVMLGCENFMENHSHIVRGRKVGLITNQTGVDSHLRGLIDLFLKNPDIELVALYAPEHGLKGDVQAGQAIPFSRHDKHDLPIYSLYGQSVEQEFLCDLDVDAQMRSFDTVEEGKIPTIAMVENVDVLVFDIQDVGTRIYTYIATMAYVMRVCAEQAIEFIVLDRPNPINGISMEGPVLEYPEFSSFVGLYPIPVRHGMTVGELALLFNERYLPKKAELTVIPMRGWARAMWFDQTGLPWIPPSPNIPNLLTATVYPGQVFLEGTNISEGRGTATPFELFGAPWIQGSELACNLRELALPGVKFQEVSFTPASSKFMDNVCGGIRLRVEDRQTYQPFCTALHIIQLIKKMHPGKFVFHREYFDTIIGSSSIRRALEKTIQVSEIVQNILPQIEDFCRQRESFLIYGEGEDPKRREL